MKEAKVPVIVLDGVEIKAGSPKAVVWRKINEFSFTSDDDVVWGMANLIAQTFNKPEVTVDAVMENVSLEELPRLYRSCCAYVLGIFTYAMENISKNG